MGAKKYQILGGPAILQETGDSETSLMSQKAITEALGGKFDAPSVTADDNGKVLMVVDGALVVTSLPIYNGEVIE